jgi:hypothetical protein
VTDVKVQEDERVLRCSPMFMMTFAVLGVLGYNRTLFT